MSRKPDIDEARAREMAFDNGLDPDARVRIWTKPGHTMPAWCSFRDAARAERLAHEAAALTPTLPPQKPEYQNNPLIVGRQPRTRHHQSDAELHEGGQRRLAPLYTRVATLAAWHCRVRKSLVDVFENEEDNVWIGVHFGSRGQTSVKKAPRATPSWLVAKTVSMFLSPQKANDSEPIYTLAEAV